MGICQISNRFLITFATGYKKTTDMNITNNMSSNGNNKKLDGEILYLRSRSRSLKLQFMIFFKFGIFTCFGQVSGWVNESK